MKRNCNGRCAAHRRQRGRLLGSLPSRPVPTKANVVNKVGSYDQARVVREAVSAVAVFGTPEHRAAARFLIHVLATARLEDAGYVPVPAKLIEKYFRRLDWRALVDVGLVEVKPYSRPRRRSREFRVSGELGRAFYEAGPTAERLTQDGLYNLMAERPTQARTKSQRRTGSGNPLPKLIRKAIDSVREVPIDVHAIERHLDQLRCAMEKSEGTTSDVASRARYFTDLRCYHAVLAQGARPIDPDNPDGLWVYRPAYKPQRFGRVSQIGGGLQSCSTTMKAVAYPPTFPPLP